MAYTSLFFLLSLFSLAAGFAQRRHSDFTRRDAVTGDSKCGTNMCVSATVNGSDVEYVLQSTGKATLGWMAMGFGSTMANTPMVILWPNSNGNITLSQRQAPGEVMPTVVSNPPRVASLSTTLSSTSGTQVQLAFTIPANSDTTQNVIYAFGTVPPSSSAVNANLQQHLESGTFQLDLTKSTTTSPSGSATNGGTTVPTGISSNTSGDIPLTQYQRIIVAHAIFCTIGFLLLLPTGALLARYFRTMTPMWFTGHWIAQFGIAGPTIVVGVIMGILSVSRAGAPHLNDDHKKWGIAIFILYLAQCGLGAVIHWVKPKNRIRRPSQNYLHAVFGLIIIALAFYQVRLGYRVEWPSATGRSPIPNGANIVWYIWVVLMPLLYIIGLAFLPRQFRQEKTKIVASSSAYDMDEYQDEVYRDDNRSASTTHLHA